MTFVWLIPLVVFTLFSSVILFHEYVRERSRAEHKREMAVATKPK